MSKNSESNHVLNGHAVSFDEIERAESCEIVKRRIAFGLPGLQGKEPVGLALSGGGIRSATFNLGVIQKLAEAGILKHVDYLSTVSGGGYIGSWLCAWIHREQQKQQSKSLAFENVRCSLSVVQPEDAPRAAQVNSNAPGYDKDTHESPKITFLRQYSNYLTPRFSIFSADTWVVGAIWARNTLLNLAMLVAVFAAIVVTLRLAGMQLWNLLAVPSMDTDCLWCLASVIVPLVPIVVLIAVNIRRASAISAEAANSPNQGPQANLPPGNAEKRIALLSFFPLISAVAYSFWLAHAHHVFVELSFWQGIEKNFVLLLPGFLIIQSFIIPSSKSETLWWRAAKVPLFSSIASLLTACLLRGVAFIFDALSSTPQKPWFIATFGPPLVLVAFTLGIVVHIGLMGRSLPESCREWLGRLGAWLTIFQAIWLFVVGISIYGPWLLLLIWGKSQIALATLGTGWLASTVGSILAGNSGKTSGSPQPNGKPPSPVLEIIARVGPYVFILGFLLAIALGVHLLLVHNLNAGTAVLVTSALPDHKLNNQFDLPLQNVLLESKFGHDEISRAAIPWLYHWYWWHLGATEILFPPESRWTLSGLVPLLAVLVVAGFFLWWRVDINLFSMHNFYKNRLVRCYLGASRQRERTPNPFTGFDDYDDIELAKFTNARGYVGPYPIVNACLNVTSGGQLQYQERKAESFVFTPCFTGFSAGTPANAMRLLDSPQARMRSYMEGNNSSEARAYRPTHCSGGGIPLGMAMAISGAAVSPNMGFHTSTAVSFLLTIFNVRLGWWLGNSLKDSSFEKPGPAFGIRYALLELLGFSNANSSFVNLSDGGHFDNMGIYELVRRRCRFIICCDAEQDEQLRFDGIANAIRKCRTDFAVDIDLPLQPLAKVNGFSSAHCVVGHIHYPDENGSYPESERGFLLYLKATLTGDEPSDVLNYHVEAPEFPHQSTADQWFDESQFESYRKLGHHIAGKALAGQEPGVGTATFFKDLHQIWYPPSTKVDEHSKDHFAMYNAIFESIRLDHGLSSLDADLFAGFAAHQNAPNRTHWNHSSGHICNSLIQLMERIFYDFHLEDRDNRKHPYVEGWLRIFAYWTHTPSFINAWALTQDSYPERFRIFYNELAA